MERGNSVTEAENKICAELWAEYEPSLRNVCKAKMHGCENDVDDIIGDVYLALCNHVAKEGLPTYQKSWLYGTLKNLINVKFREKYRDERHMANFSIDEIELPYKHDFVSDVEDNNSINELNSIIGTLNKDEQVLIYSTYFDKKKMKEIAKELGSTESAVKQRRYRLCNKLRKLLEGK